MQDLHAGTIGGHLEDNSNSKAVLLARWSQTGAILCNCMPLNMEDDPQSN